MRCPSHPVAEGGEEIEFYIHINLAKDLSLTDEMKNAIRVPQAVEQAYLIIETI